MTRIRPDWSLSLSPSPSPSPSSRAPEPPSSPSPLLSSRHTRSGWAEARAGDAGGGGEGRRGDWRSTVQKPSPDTFYRAASEWMTSGPRQSNHIPKQSHVRDTWRKRRRGNRGVYALSHPSTAVRPASRASQNSDPTKSANSRSICQTRDFLRSVARK